MVHSPIGDYYVTGDPQVSSALHMLLPAGSHSPAHSWPHCLARYAAAISWPTQASLQLLFSWQCLQRNHEF